MTNLRKTAAVVLLAVLTVTPTGCRNNQAVNAGIIGLSEAHKRGLQGHVICKTTTSTLGLFGTRYGLDIRAPEDCAAKPWTITKWRLTVHVDYDSPLDTQGEIWGTPTLHDPDHDPRF